MTKTQAAFLLSVEKLFAMSKAVYFWTFTFKKVYPDWWYPGAWRKFALDVTNLYGGYVCGLRVLEAHKEHGLHYHLLVNRRINIHLMLRMAKRYGFGRIGVERADKGSGRYLAKYLAKENKLHGVARWHSFGAFEAVRVSDVVIESEYMEVRRSLGIEGRLKIGYEGLLRGAYHNHGERGMRLSWELMHRGMIGEACKLVSPNVIITEKGGMKYLRGPDAIAYRVSKQHRLTY